MNRLRTLPLLLAGVLALGACATSGTDMLSADAPRALPAPSPPAMPHIFSMRPMRRSRLASDARSQR